MCGIAGIHVKPTGKGKLPIGKMLDQLLLGIEPRGREATGYVSVSFDGNVNIDKAGITAKKFINKRKPLTGKTQTVLAHTRLATKGSVTDNANNHPVIHGSVMAVHNGVLYNDDELFAQFEWQRTAAVDSIAIPASLYEYSGLDDLGRAGKALEELDGAFAIGAIDVSKPNRVLIAKGFSSPLFFLETKDFYVWASTVEAVQGMWATVFGTPPKAERFKSLQAGDMVLIENGVAVWDEFDASANWQQYTYGYNTQGSALSRALGESTGTTFDGRTAEWVNSGTGAKVYREGNTPIRPALADLDAMESYAEWAEVDLELVDDAINDVAYDMDLPHTTVRWILFHTSNEVIDAIPEMGRVKAYLKQEFQASYDMLLASSTRTADPEPVTVMPWERECIFCGDPHTEEGLHCASCRAFRREMASDAHESGGLLGQIALGSSVLAQIGEEATSEDDFEERVRAAMEPRSVALAVTDYTGGE